jgi:hypothetical protein
VSCDKGEYMAASSSMHMARKTWRKGSDSGLLAAGADGVASLVAMIVGICTDVRESSNEGDQLQAIF